MFTAITFSPVTEFIEKTRKLRDLYGSSFILSYLSESVCKKARKELGEDAVVSPALLKMTMGTPDQIVIKGDFPEKKAKAAFDTAWESILEECYDWITRNCHQWIDQQYDQWGNKQEWNPKESRPLPWDGAWNAWKNHAWEFFWVQGEEIPDTLDALAKKEGQNRNWVGINWLGESSTLSGTDAIAWPGLGRNIPPKLRRVSEEDEQIREFLGILNQKIGEALLNDDLINHKNHLPSYLRSLAKRHDIESNQRENPKNANYDNFLSELGRKLGEAIITEREQLSIPELVKRLTTLNDISEALEMEKPDSFRDVNLWTTDQPMAWFRGDGDKAGEYIRSITQDPETAPQELQTFSQQMRQWGQWLQKSFDQKLGRIVYAGGDDFLGVFYEAETPIDAIDWLSTFKENVWHKGENDKADPKPITPSIGFVWASSQIPQREILQHCEQAERTAKDSGRDRVALRVLFSSGTHLEWTCPWWLLSPIVQGYRDRNWPSQDSLTQQNWTHFYNDVATLKARHAFDGNNEVALGLFNLYFADPKTGLSLLPTEPSALFDLNNDNPIWTQTDGTETLSGILSDDVQGSPKDQQDAFNHWVISLAEVGFHLFNSGKISAETSYNAA